MKRLFVISVLFLIAFAAGAKYLAAPPVSMPAAQVFAAASTDTSAEGAAPAYYNNNGDNAAPTYNRPVPKH